MRVGEQNRPSGYFGMHIACSGVGGALATRNSQVRDRDFGPILPQGQVSQLSPPTPFLTPLNMHINVRLRHDRLCRYAPMQVSYVYIVSKLHYVVQDFASVKILTDQLISSDL